MLNDIVADIKALQNARTLILEADAKVWNQGVDGGVACMFDPNVQNELKRVVHDVLAYNAKRLQNLIAARKEELRAYILNLNIEPTTE